MGSVLHELVVEYSVNLRVPDCHFRVGGALGSGLGLAQCPKSTGPAKQGCIAASMLLHVTAQSSAYLENVWAWTADHDMDDPMNTQIDVYSARGKCPYTVDRSLY